MSSPPESASSSLHCAKDAADIAAWISRRSPPSADDAVADLIASDVPHAPDPGSLTRLRGRSADAARQDSVSWILKARDFHRFSPVTAFLAVIYFDRFLSSHSLPVSH